MIDHIYWAFFDEMRKIAGLGMDLRQNGPAGTKRPPFPTEESKSYAKQKLKRALNISEAARRKPPEPKIRSVASI